MLMDRTGIPSGGIFSSVFQSRMDHDPITTGKNADTIAATAAAFAATSPTSRNLRGGSYSSGGRSSGGAYHSSSSSYHSSSSGSRSSSRSTPIHSTTTTTTTTSTSASHGNNYNSGGTSYHTYNNYNYNNQNGYYTSHRGSANGDDGAAAFFVIFIFIILCVVCCPACLPLLCTCLCGACCGFGPYSVSSYNYSNNPTNTTTTTTTSATTTYHSVDGNGTYNEFDGTNDFEECARRAKDEVESASTSNTGNKASSSVYGSYQKGTTTNSSIGDEEPYSGLYSTSYVDRTSGVQHDATMTLHFSRDFRGKGYKISGEGHDIDGQTVIEDGHANFDGTAWWRERTITKDVGLKVLSRGKFDFANRTFYGTWLANTMEHGAYITFQALVSAPAVSAVSVAAATATTDTTVPTAVPSAPNEDDDIPMAVAKPY